MTCVFPFIILAAWRKPVYAKQLFLGLIHCIVTSLVFEMCHILIEFESCLLDSSCPNKTDNSDNLRLIILFCSCH